MQSRNPLQAAVGDALGKNIYICRKHFYLCGIIFHFPQYTRCVVKRFLGKSKNAAEL